MAPNSVEFRPEENVVPKYLLSADLSDDEETVAGSMPTGGSHKPSHQFDMEDDFEDEMELGVVGGSKHKSRRRHWWESVPLAGQKSYGSSQNGESRNSLLAGKYSEPNLRAKKTFFNYFLYSGISGLMVLMILLSFNILLGFASLKLYGCVNNTVPKSGGMLPPPISYSGYATDFTRDIRTIPCHSHNDYWRKPPLFEALSQGFLSVEADVWLYGEELYVGHNEAALTKNRTFQSLYVHPLVELLERQNPTTEFYNGSDHGVYDTDDGKSLILLVDVKTDGNLTWPWVLAQLEPLRKRNWLTYVENDVVTSRPITVVGTGNTPFNLLTANTTYRDAFFDAPLSEMWEPLPGEDATPPTVGKLGSMRLGRAEDETWSMLPRSAIADVGQGLSGVDSSTIFNASNSFYASVDFNSAIGPLVEGKLTPRQLSIIRGQLRGAHSRGLKARYWDLPAWPIQVRNYVWEVLVRDGVDFLNVDDLVAASKLIW